MRTAGSQSVHRVFQTPDAHRQAKRGGHRAGQEDRGHLSQMAVPWKQADGAGDFKAGNSREPQARPEADAEDGARGGCPRSKDKQAASAA